MTVDPVVCPVRRSVSSTPFVGLNRFGAMPMRHGGVKPMWMHPAREPVRAGDCAPCGHSVGAITGFVSAA